MDGEARDISASIPLAFLAYVERALGPAAREEAHRRAGAASTALEGLGDDAWVSLSTAEALIAACRDLTADPAIGRLAGEALFRRHREIGLVDHIAAEDGPAAALCLTVEFSSRLSRYRTFEVVDRGDLGLVVSARSERPGRTDVYCQLSAGYWSLVPSLFGTDGTATHTRCQSRGDGHCEWVLRWDAPQPADGAERATSRSRSEARAERFAALQLVATELARAEDVPDVARRAVAGLGMIVTAPVLLATLRAEDGTTAVESRGLGEEPASAASDALWAGTATDPDLGTAVPVPIASPRRLHGYLVAFLPPGAQASPLEQRIVRTYADHVAAAVERTELHLRAERDHRSASETLQLARRLASAATRAEVCERLAEGIPAATGADVAAIWLWQPSARRFRFCRATEGWEAGPDLGAGPAAAAWATGGPAAARAAGGAGPVVLAGPAPGAAGTVGATGAASEAVTASEAGEAATLGGWDVAVAVAVPVRLGADLLGIVAIGRREPLEEAGRLALLDQASAVADQAASALHAARAFEQIAHQAHHDPLTGLANRAHAEERVAAVLAEGEVPGRHHALLFVDLDRFKVVNDTLGHPVGDQLLQEVARRLAATVRHDDLVARLGGDEFLVLVGSLRERSASIATARAVVAAVEAPVVVDGHRLQVSCSVGIARVPEHGDSFDALLRHADEAMYRAKAQGPGSIAVHGEPTCSRAA